MCSIGYIDTIFIPLSSNVVDPNGENFSRARESQFPGLLVCLQLAFVVAIMKGMKHGALVQKSGMMRKNPFLKRMRLQMTKSRSISVKSRSGFPTGREKTKNKTKERD